MTFLAATSLHAVDPSVLAPLSSIPPAGTFLSLAQTNWAPMPADPFPQLNLYTDGTNFYYDDRGVDLSALTPFASPAAQSNVRVAGAEDVPPPPDPGPGPFTGTGSTASAAQFYPPSTNYVACESYTNFWLDISAASDDATITITNTLPALSYELLEKANLSEPAWTVLGTLTATRNYVQTNVSMGANDTYFYQARLTTNDQPPEITQLPQCRITTGNTATFTVTATGLALSYQWYSNITALVNGGHVSGATSDTLTITSFAPSNATYSVVVSNAICYEEAPVQFLWTNHLGGTITASPAVGPDGTIYIVNEQNEFFALSPLNGYVLWSNTIADRMPGYEVQSSPAVAPDNSAVYIGTENAAVVAYSPLNSTSNHLSWTNYLGTNDDGAEFVATPAIGADGEVYIGNYSAGYYTDGTFALSSNGDLDWRCTNFDQYAAFGPIDISSSVAIGPDCTIYSINEGGDLYALNKDGSLRWIFPVLANGAQGSSPAVGADGTLYFGSTDNYLYAVSPLGQLIWTLGLSPYETNQLSPIHSSPAMGPDGTIYFGSSDGHLYAVSPQGQLLWALQETNGDAFDSSPAVAADGTIYIGSGDPQAYEAGNVYAVTNGHVKWIMPCVEAVISSPAIAPNGAVYIASSDGYLYSLAGSAPPADSPWPMFHQNAQRTGAAPNPTCSGLTGPTFVPNNPGKQGQPASFNINGAPGSSCEVYVSTNLSAWSLLDNVTIPIGQVYTNFIDNSAGAGTGNRIYQMKSGSYCSDIIGYVNIRLAKGTNLVATQLYGANNPTAPSFTPQNSLTAWGVFLTAAGLSITTNLSIIKWDGEGFQTNTYIPNGTGWTTGADETLLPGQSQFFVSSSAMTVTFAGRVARGLQSISINSKTNYLSSILPVAGYLKSNLQFSPSNGDVIQLYTPGSSRPTPYTYSGGAWSPGEPYLSVGEGFVLVTSNTNNNWQTNFSVCAGE